MSRQRAAYRLNSHQLAALLGGGLSQADVFGVVHDPMRAQFTIVIDSTDLDPVDEGCEAPVQAGLEMTMRAAVAHPALGELITILGTEVRNDDDDDLVGWLAAIRELVYDDEALRAVFDPAAKVTPDTKSDLLYLAAFATAVASRTLSEGEAADYVALEEALDPLAEAVASMEAGTLIPTEELEDNLRSSMGMPRHEDTTGGMG